MARPRNFDEDDVLDRAMRLFWERGYEGASLHELLAATGLTKSSIYKAFGSKEALFRRIVERYDRHFLGFRREALAEKTPRAIVERLLMGMAELHAGQGTPPGCLATNAALACSPEADTIRIEMARDREIFRNVLRDRLTAASARGPLPVGTDADTAATLVHTMIQGMAVQAKSGIGRVEMERVVRAFLMSWPEQVS
jgi:AcrR family transcriptional regulator